MKDDESKIIMALVIGATILGIILLVIGAQDCSNTAALRSECIKVGHSPESCAEAFKP